MAHSIDGGTSEMVDDECNDSRVLDLLLMLNGCQLVHRFIHRSFLIETVRFPEYEERVAVYAVLLKKFVRGSPFMCACVCTSTQ